MISLLNGIKKRYEVEYPFHRILCDWTKGCRTEWDEHPYYGGNGSTYLADGIGKAVYEVIRKVDMPNPYKDRVVYRFYFVNPGGVKMRKRVDTATDSAFLKRTRGIPISYDMAGSED